MPSGKGASSLSPRAAAVVPLIGLAFCMVWALTRAAAPAPTSGGASVLESPQAAEHAKTAPSAPGRVVLLPGRTATRASPSAQPAEPPLVRQDPGGAVPWGELATRWSQEEHDADWTDNLTGYFNRLLDRPDAGPPLLRSIDCRRTICQAHLGFKPGAIQEAQQALQDEGFGFQYRLHNTDGGVPVVSVFVNRNGF